MPVYKNIGKSSKLLLWMKLHLTRKMLIPHMTQQTNDRCHIHLLLLDTLKAENLNSKNHSISKWLNDYKTDTDKIQVF